MKIIIDKFNKTITVGHVYSRQTGIYKYKNNKELSLLKKKLVSVIKFDVLKELDK